MSKKFPEPIGANRHSLDFSNGIMLEGSNCELVGHSYVDPILSYDFKGIVTQICKRPWCHEAMKATPVDDLTESEYTSLMNIIRTHSG